MIIKMKKICSGYYKFIKYLNNDFFKKHIYYSYLPLNFKAFVCKIPKIIINISVNGLSIINNKDNNLKDDEITNILKAYCIIILIHECFHFIIKYFSNKKIYDLQKTPPKIEDEILNFIYESGESLIYYLTGKFIIKNYNNKLANFINDIKNWKLKKNNFKEKIKNLLGENEESENKIINENGGIKCMYSKKDEKKIEEKVYSGCGIAINRYS